MDPADSSDIRHRSGWDHHCPLHRELKTPLTIFLINGVKLQGVITTFDGFTVLLVRDGFSQLVYKQAKRQEAISKAKQKICSRRFRIKAPRVRLAVEHKKKPRSTGMLAGLLTKQLLRH